MTKEVNISREEKLKRVEELVNSMNFLDEGQKEIVINIECQKYCSSMILTWFHLKKSKTDLDFEIEDIESNISVWNTRACTNKKEKIAGLKKELDSLLERQRIQNEPINKALSIVEKKRLNCYKKYEKKISKIINI